MHQISIKLWWILTFSMLILLGAGYVFFHNHAPGQSQWLPSCWFHDLTGLFCPGCGVTRATHAVFNGQWGRAVSMNLLAVLAAPSFVLIWLDKGGLISSRFSSVVSFVSDARFWAVVVLTFMFARNLPWAPFSWLAPGGWA